MCKNKDLKDKATEVIAAAVEGVEALAEKAAEASKPLTDKAVEIGEPIAKKAVEATKSAFDDLEGRGEAALSAVEKHAKKKSHTGRKVFLWSLAAAGIGGVAYLFWRRSRPVEDPWAEDYWVDLKDEEGPVEIDVENADSALDDAIVEAIEEALASSETEGASDTDTDSGDKK